MDDPLRKYLQSLNGTQDNTKLKPKNIIKTTDEASDLAKFGKSYLSRNQGEIKPYKEPDLRHKLTNLANYIDRDGKSPVGSLISEPMKSAARLSRPSQYLDKIKTESDILPTLTDAAMDAADFVGGVGEAGGLGLKLVGRINHPLTKTLEPALKHGMMKNWTTAALMGTADKLAPLITKTPGLKKMYKDVAYEIASQSSAANRELDDVSKVFFGKYFGSKKSDYSFYKDRNTYDGTVGVDTDGSSITGRNLLKQYIYGDDVGFTPTSIKPTGLDKYSERYGPIKSFSMNVADKHLPVDYMNLREPLVQKVVKDQAPGTMPSDALEKGRHIYQDPERFKLGLNKFMDKHGVDEINFGVEGATHIPILDDVAGHVGYIKRQPGGDFTYRSQDIWKFTPEDYDKKWNRYSDHQYANDYPEEAHKYIKEDARQMLENYGKRKQAGLMDKAGKPFILQDERPINFNKPSIEEDLINDVDLDYHNEKVFKDIHANGGNSVKQMHYQKTYKVGQILPGNIQVTQMEYMPGGVYNYTFDVAEH